MTTTPAAALPADPYTALVHELADTLERAAVVQAERGLYRGYFAAPGRDDGPVDPRGAINLVVNGDPTDCGPAEGLAARAALQLAVYLAVAPGGLDHDDSPDLVALLAHWSDSPRRTAENAAEAMRECARDLVTDLAEQN